jgi:phospholipid/cholesterol/gamma-HCH transport system substrate-binding protein
MRLTRKTILQLAILALVGAVTTSLLVFSYMRVPALLGIGQYTVTVQLNQAAGLYPSGNVTYRGTEVGRVRAVRLTNTGVEAELSLRSDVHIPADVEAQVRSVSAVGEQYVQLLPRSANGPILQDGSVIPVSRTSTPPEIGPLLDAAVRGVQAIPPDNVKTVVDESYTALGGLSPEFSRLVKGSTQLAIDARANLDSLTTVIDRAAPLLDSQTDSAQDIHAWAAHLADLTHQLQANDSAVAGILTDGPPAAANAQQLIDRLQPALPVLLANLVSVGEVAVTYQPALEQLLVLIPAGTAILQVGALANKDTKHPGQYLDFNLNLNLPQACTTGFLPAQQIRPPTQTDVPERPAGDLYCRIPQDAPYNAVRGARNYPCLTRPGKRAPTVQMCESDEQYVPLNDGYNWKGDPNATLSGQDVPQLPAAAPPPPAPLAVASYDPVTGTYVGPDGRTYTQSDLAEKPKGTTWQDMLTPPGN